MKKNIPRLIAEWLTIVFSAVGGIFLAAHRRNSALVITGGFSISIGLFLAAIVCFSGWK